MHAVTITKDKDLIWSERDEPAVGDTQILVKVHAAGVNNADLLQRAGFYPPPAGIPAEIPGLEMSGEVVSVGRRVDRFEVGDRVMALVGGAAQAELAVTDQETALRVPSTMDPVAAGAFMEAAATAYDALLLQAGLGLGEKVLVTGAAGGVGVAAVQIAALAGAEVVASTRHETLAERLVGLGADRAAQPDGVAGHGPYDVIVELVGGPHTADSVDALGTGGRIVVIGIGAGARFELDLRALMHKRARVMASTMRARPLVDRAVVIGALGDRFCQFVEAGRYEVPICATFAMRDAKAAYEKFSEGGKFGKVVLVTEACPDRS